MVIIIGEWLYIEYHLGEKLMPLRGVAPLDEIQWKYLMDCLFSEKPEFVKRRKKMQKAVREAFKRSKVIKHC